MSSDISVRVVLGTALISFGLAIPAAAIPPTLIITKGLDVISSGETFDLGDVRVGEQTGVALTLKNVGDETLEFRPFSVVIGGPPTNEAGLSVNSFPTTLPDVRGLLSTALPIGFRVLRAGQVRVEFVVHSNDPVKPEYLVVLQANGIQPVITASVNGTDVTSGDTVDLGDVQVGQDVQVDLLVQNTGDATLNVQQVLLDLKSDGGAALANTVPLTIDQGQSETIPLTFRALVEGEQVARLNLLNDSDDNPFVVLLRANGFAADQNAQAGTCGFGAAPALPMALLGLVSLKLCPTRRMRRG